MQRNQDHRERVLSAISRAWERYPDERLAQLIVNAVNRFDPFYVEDDDLVARLEKYAERRGDV